MTIQDDLHGAYALLAAFADPAKAKERLDRLAADHQKRMDDFAVAHAVALEAEQRRSEETAALAETRKAVDEQRSTAEAALMAHRLEAEQFKRESHAEKHKLETLKVSVNEQMALLSVDKATMADHRRQMDERDEALRQKEALIRQHEDVALKSRYDAENLKKSYNERLAALRHAMAETD
jgi:IgA-specific serine endopeptidase